MSSEKDAENFSKGLAERVIECLPADVGFAFILFHLNEGKESWISCVSSGDREELLYILAEYVDLQLKEMKERMH